MASTSLEATRRYLSRAQLSVAADRQHAAVVIQARVRSPELADRMVHRAQREIWTKHTCTHRVETVVVLVAHGFDPASPRLLGAIRAGLLQVTAVAADASLTLGERFKLAVELATGDVLSKMDNDDYYAPHYLADLLDATTCAHADRLGKQALHMRVEAQGATPLPFPPRSPVHGLGHGSQDYRVA